MDTLSYKMPRMTRAKALIGAFVASIALTGAVQTALPASASAMPARCEGLLNLGHKAYAEHYYWLASFYWGAMMLCIEEEP
jgi:hypothetical protein